MSSKINIEDVMKVEMRVGLVEQAEKVQGSSKLVKLIVNFGEKIGERTIFAGVRKWYAPSELAGKQLAFFTNLEPRRMGDIGVSEGMLVAVEVMRGEERTAVLMLPDQKVPLGSRLI